MKQAFHYISLLRNQTMEFSIYISFLRCRRKLVTALNGAVQSLVSFLRHRIRLSLFSKLCLRWSTWVGKKQGFHNGLGQAVIQFKPVIQCAKTQITNVWKKLGFHRAFRKTLLLSSFWKSGYQSEQANIQIKQAQIRVSLRIEILKRRDFLVYVVYERI